MFKTFEFFTELLARLAYYIVFVALAEQETNNVTRHHTCRHYLTGLGLIKRIVHENMRFDIFFPVPTIEHLGLGERLKIQFLHPAVQCFCLFFTHLLNPERLHQITVYFAGMLPVIVLTEPSHTRSLIGNYIEAVIEIILE